MTKRCDDCKFKFEPSDKGRHAKVCPSCREARKDKWRRDAKKRAEQSKDLNWVPAVSVGMPPRSQGDNNEKDQRDLKEKVFPTPKSGEPD